MYRINRIPLCPYDDRNYILKDGYSRLTLIFVQHRQFVLIFTLFRRTICSDFFQCYKVFFLFNNIFENYSPKWKTKKKQINKKVLPNQKRKITRVYRNITENEKTKKRKYAHNENKNMSL